MQNYDTKVGRNTMSSAGPGMINGKKSNKMDGGEISTGTGSNGRQSKIEGFGSGSSKGLGSMPCNSAAKDPKSSVQGFSGGELGGKV